MKNKSVRGFTLVELLVVIAIIGVLVAMAIPAVQASREVGRRTYCRTNLAQIMLAVQNYESAFESLPAGVVNPDGPIRCEPVGLHQGWLVQLLPYLDQGNAYRLVDFSASVYAPVNAQVRELSPSIFVCPSEPLDGRGVSNYAGCHNDVEAPIAADNHGVLFLNSHIRREDITDGAAHTIFVGEKRIEPGDLGWMSGTRATLRNTGLPLNDPLTQLAAGPSTEAAARAIKLPQQAEDAAADPTSAITYVGGFGSPHVNGAFIGFGDGSVKFIAEDIDLQLWQQLGNRADGKLLKVDLTDHD
jgi:prepilin-type N-terminal cleavage/methylation domain-containing protein